MKSEETKLELAQEIMAIGEGLVQFLSSLPEDSYVGRPKNDVVMQQSSENATTTMQQSRFEVLWRTMLTDCLGEHHPAPVSSGEAILADMQYAIYVKMTAAMCPSLQKRAFSDTGIIYWKFLSAEIGREYIDWKRLQGHCPYDREELLCPHGFKITMRKLGWSWNYQYPLENTNQVAKICDLVLQRAAELANASHHRLAVRNKALAACVGKILFITNQDQIGTALQSAKIGEEVWVLAGASIPFVLRPNWNGSYRLLGQAYVHGMMHGEVARSSSLERASNIVLV